MVLTCIMCLFQIYFDVGQVLFEQEKYSKSLECFQLCQELLQSITPSTSSSSFYPSVDKDQLRGYVSACSSFDVGWVEGEEADEARQDEEAGTIVMFEQLRKSPETALVSLH